MFKGCYFWLIDPGLILFAFANYNYCVSSSSVWFRYPKWFESNRVDWVWIESSDLFNERDIDDPFPSLGLRKIFNLLILQCKATNIVERVQIDLNK